MMIVLSSVFYRAINYLALRDGRPLQTLSPCPIFSGRFVGSPVLRILLFSFSLLLIQTDPATAQELPTDILAGDQVGTRAIQLFLLLTVLTIAPGILIMLTCFPFIVTVLAILRQAIGLQQSPPNMLLVSLAIFLTWYVMDPVLSAAWTAGIQPYLDGQISVENAFLASMDPFRAFMAARVNIDTLTELSTLRGFVPSSPEAIETYDLSVLVPSFLLSEVEKAFQVGFLIFLPFLIIDLVVAAVLMSMGMMMVPPAIVSLPFKLAFFVVADGWTLIASSLVRGYM